MSLFDGVENFTPAFTGQRIATEVGQGAGQSISRGMSMVNQSKGRQLDQDQFNFQKQQYNEQVGRLDAFRAYLQEGMP